MSLHITTAAIAAAAAGDFANALVAATPGGIERQEKEGQQALVQSTDMPLTLTPGREAFEKVGFTFGEEVNDLFCNATLPAGWKKVATDHSMWSKIVDDQGRERVSIFYKAAFYDREAFGRLVGRYTLTTLYSGEGIPKDHNVCVVKDGDNVVWRGTPARSRDWDAQEAQSTAGTAWLAEKFPDWRDPTAYW